MREYFAFTSWMGILFGSVTATTGLATFVLSDALPGDPLSRGIGAVVLVTAVVTPIALAGYRRLGVCAAENRCDNCRREPTTEGLDVDHIPPLRAGPVAAVAARRARVAARGPLGARRQRSGGRFGPDGVLRPVRGRWPAQRAV